ncbi:DUF6262 family protein [Streptomyces sp. NPDC058385]|uniref:DUF6262 family protein n=1 Tax=Streptomyces sp. NPDC058385 TaxID=3346473 RepID=UPI0036499276
MSARMPAEVLAASRRRTSVTKRQRVFDTLQHMLDGGEQITFREVARRARVSTWLVYADGVRGHVQAAIDKQDAGSVRARSNGELASSASLKADLVMAHEEVRALRDKCERLQSGMRHNLGQQLDQISQLPLAERITELTDANRKLEAELAELRPLKKKAHALEVDLPAARTSLRQMIRDTNQGDKT